MSDTRPESGPRGVRLDEAVRRATPLKRVAKPDRRSLLRALAVYANVFAVLVALGIPNGTLRQAAGGAMASFDGVVRQTSAEVMYAVSSNLAYRVDTSLAESHESAAFEFESASDDAASESVVVTTPPASDVNPDGAPSSTAVASDPVMSPSAFPSYQVAGED